MLWEGEGSRCLFTPIPLRPTTGGGGGGPQVHTSIDGIIWQCWRLETLLSIHGLLVMPARHGRDDDVCSARRPSSHPPKPLPEQRIAISSPVQAPSMHTPSLSRLHLTSVCRASASPLAACLLVRDPSRFSLPSAANQPPMSHPP